MIKYKSHGIKSLWGNKLVIDESYCGNDDDWGYPVYATRNVTIPKGTRLCQFRINKKQPEIIFEEVNDLKSSARGGFGTSGA